MLVAAIVWLCDAQRTQPVKPLRCGRRTQGVPPAELHVRGGERELVVSSSEGHNGLSRIESNRIESNPAMR